MHAQVTGYHLEAVDFTPPGDVGQCLVPAMDVAIKLIERYLDSVDPIFPIVPKSFLIEVYDNVYMYGADSHNQQPNSDLSTLNLVFAIGKAFSDRLGEPPENLPTSHETYFTRASLLGALCGTDVFSAAVLENVQNLGLVGMYFLATHQANRQVALHEV